MLFGPECDWVRDGMTADYVMSLERHVTRCVMESECRGCDVNWA
jgi:hypothetical protein